MSSPRRARRKNSASLALLPGKPASMYGAPKAARRVAMLSLSATDTLRPSLEKCEGRQAGRQAGSQAGMNTILDSVETKVNATHPYVPSRSVVS